MSEGHQDHTKHYIKMYLILMVLFSISVLGPLTGIKWVMLITAFGIAVVKAYIVVAYFMHLKFEKKVAIYIVSVSLGLMFLFYFAVAPDVHNHEGRNWENVAAKKSIADGFAAAKADEAAHHAGGAHGSEHPAEGDSHEGEAEHPESESNEHSE